MKHATLQPDPAAVAKALADEGRLRILAALADGELCVCQVVELISLAPSTISRHLAILSGARLILSRKEGRWVYYRLNRDGGSVIRGAMDWAIHAFCQTETGIEDARRMRRILAIKPEVLCCRQRQSE